MDMKKIGTFLTRLRKERGLTQEQLGEMLGVSNKTISRWETGVYLPPVEMLQSLSGMYGITINEILSGERLTSEEYREKAEENIKTALDSSPFTLEEKIDYYKKKWRKDHYWSSIVARALIWVLLAIGIVTREVLWTIPFVIANVIYDCMERNRMMTYVEAHAFDGSGEQ